MEFIVDTAIHNNVSHVLKEFYQVMDNYVAQVVQEVLINTMAHVKTVLNTVRLAPHPLIARNV